MKKTYIIPSVCMVEVEPNRPMALSNQNLESVPERSDFVASSRFSDFLDDEEEEEEEIEDIE